jgi:hypothetical protein
VCFTDLEKGVNNNGGPCWTPDGKTIIFLIVDDHPNVDDLELIFVAADGSDVRRMPLGKERTWWGQFDCR